MDFSYAIMKNKKEIIAVFSTEEYAKDFLDYQATICDDEFEIVLAKL